MIDTERALELVKLRLNRATGYTPLDTMLEARIASAIGELEATGITLTDSTEDLMLVVDYAVWQYSSRDKQTGMPEWLRLRRRERWLKRDT